METCTDCGRAIPATATALVWRDRIVCAPCRGRLIKSSKRGGVFGRFYRAFGPRSAIFFTTLASWSAITATLCTLSMWGTVARQYTTQERAILFSFNAAAESDARGSALLIGFSFWFAVWVAIALPLFIAAVATMQAGREPARQLSGA